MPPEARIYEPRISLDGGPDGLAVLRRVSAAAPLWLAPGGHLLVETSERQAPLAVEALATGRMDARIVSFAETAAVVAIATLPTC
jgi:release factor glutamine methyltransferase